ncbi:MAG TPA: hypothetical protein VIK55_06580 [Paludibacter sp.]
MPNFKAVITETTAKDKGLVIANTKSPSQYRGMNKEQFTEATKYLSAFSISIIEF